MGDESPQAYRQQRRELLGLARPESVDDWRRRFEDGSYPTDFWTWLADNRHVLEAFIKTALEEKARGRARWSARSIFHVLRWQSQIAEGGQKIVKVNNNATAGLARLAPRLEPKLQGFFITRGAPNTAHGRRLVDGRRYGEREDLEA